MGLRTATIGVLGSAVVLMAGSVGAATPALGASCPGPSFSGGKETLTFCYTGSQQTWKVPSGVNSVTFDLFGAQGGTGGAGGAGGKGAEVTKTMTVTPGSTVYIYIGGRGTDGLASGGTLPVAGGFNGGGTGGGSGSSSSGAGGGASDIRTDGFALTDRKLVAGGGGGGGDSNGVGGVGGDTTGGDGAHELDPTDTLTRKLLLLKPTL